MKISTILALLISTLFITSCKEKPTEPNILIVDDSLTISNSIKLKHNWSDFDKISLSFTKSDLDSTAEYTYVLERKGNNYSIETYFRNIKKDTTVIINAESGGLIKGITYQYMVRSFHEGRLIDTSNTLKTKLLEVTTHDFVWEIDTLGEPGHSGIKGLWGVDENNVWAIGGIGLEDGGGNFIKWNGEKWSTVTNEPLAVNGIFGFSENDIWLVGYGLFQNGAAIHYNGIDLTWYRFDNPTPEDTIYYLQGVWGASPDDVWAVGPQGTIIHWDGNSWTKVKSESKAFLRDIWGSSANNIYASGLQSSGVYELLKYDGVEWKRITGVLNSDRLSLWTVWTDKIGRVVLAGNRLAWYDGNAWNSRPYDSIFMNSLRVRGNDFNNIFIVGQERKIIHFNGTDWKKYDDIEIENSFNNLLSIAVFENNVIIGGKTLEGTLVIYGKRK